MSQTDAEFLDLLLIWQPPSVSSCFNKRSILFFPTTALAWLLGTNWNTWKKRLIYYKEGSRPWCSFKDQKSTVRYWNVCTRSQSWKKFLMSNRSLHPDNLCVFVLDTFEAEFPRNIEHWIVIIVCQTRKELKKFRYDCNGASPALSGCFWPEGRLLI
jgi:hypothetical protein